MMIKMKRRKPVLDINGESDYQRRRWPNERIPRNGSPSNPLVGLVGQYNSDSENEDEMRPANKLNDKVNDFFKEIQSIAPDKVENQNNTNSTMNLPSSLWQECYDESTGYPYYWHIKTNEVTWEMPAELKALLNKDKKDSTPPVPSHGSKIPQWSSEMVKKFSDNENNIPDGMIPKEVVARNRNRQAGIFHNIPKKPTEKSSKKQGFKRESSDDEKIEMITSFGNEESESEESEDDKSNTKTSKKITGSQNMKIQQKDMSNYNKKSEIIDKTMGPDLPQTIYGPANNRKLSEALSQSLKVLPEEKNILNTENDILNRLKNQAKALQNIQKNTELTTSNLFNDKQKDLKLSLVPGYEDDSDGDDSQIHKQNSKPLFPISGSKFQANVLNKELLEDNRPVKQLELSTGNIRIYDYRSESENKDSNNEENPNSQSNESSIIDKNESGNDQEKKINKFLDDIDAPSKAFQRKKRIAFDVAPNKSKTQESQENLNTKEEYALHEYTESVDNTNRQGLGFSREEKKIDKKSKPERNVESLNKKAGISFVKGETVNSKNEDQNKKLTETIEKEKSEFKIGMDSILEKLRFLSEGSPTISAVQIMGIQLQTLICAWESKDLEETYLRNWVENTSCELTRLEKTAAPPGWECQWDRAHKRYYYRNTATGEAQWTYPQSDIAGGTEEMDLCTTPPPEQEEPSIIEMNVLNSNMNNTEKVSKNKNNIDPEIKTQPPPPPMISSPSPPPPPKIFAEDLKQQSLKRKAASPEKSLDVVKEKISKDSIDKCHQKVLKPEHCETISQNVETTELSYALSGHPLEALYAGHQQSNPIYAATLGATGIPILPHHPSLVPGQIMHYPTYHQHLHNQALVARLSSQEAMQFMVAAEYARVYENNQVIAKPPVKVPQESSLGSAINSFYSDIAVIEKNSETEKEKVDARAVDASTSSNQITSQVEGIDSIGTDSTLKEKKKKKLKAGLGKKQKEMSSMVAKWQKAQKNYAED